MNVERSNPVRFGGAVEGRLAPVGSRDAFGRWRSSDPYQLFASALYHDAQPLLWDDQQVSGAGTTSTYNANQSTVTLAVSAATAGIGGDISISDVKNSGIARIGSPTGWNLGASIAGVPDELWLCAKRLTGTTEDFYAGITTGEVP